MTNANEMAYPCQNRWDAGSESMDLYSDATGLTKREYFAAMALQGILSGNPHDLVSEAENQDLLTKDAVAVTSLEFADALIAALNQEVAKDATA